MNASQRRKYGKLMERLNRRSEALWLPRVEKVLRLKVTAVIQRLRSGGQNEANRYLLETPGNPALTAAIRKLYLDVGIQHAKRVWKDLNAEPTTLKSVTSWLQLKRTGALGRNEEWVKYILAYLENNLTTKLTWYMDNTTRDNMLAAINAEFAKGKGVDDVIALLLNWPKPRYWAARIIRTEINRAANVGTQAAGESFGFEQQKEWIAAKDSRTRGNPMNGQRDHANHWSLDGTVVDEKGTFTDPRNGDLLQFPGDPAGSAASVINCRCSAALTAKRDENGRLIRKQAQQRRITVIMPNQNNNNRQIVTI